jgi:hypothetical protein
MKSGAGSDPFADDTPDEDEDSVDGEVTDADETPSSDTGEAAFEPLSEEPASTSETETEESGPGPDESLPYLFARDGVKDERRMVQYFLREATMELETESQRAVEEELGTDVYLTDLREALVRVGAENLDAVTEELRSWGYRFEEK